MMSQASREPEAAAVAAAVEQLRAADRAYQEAWQQYERIAAHLRAYLHDELVSPARRKRLRAVQTLAELTSAREVSRVLGRTVGRARQLMAEAQTELTQDQPTVENRAHSRRSDPFLPG